MVVSIAPYPDRVHWRQAISVYGTGRAGVRIGFRQWRRVAGCRPVENGLRSRQGLNAAAVR